MTGCLPLRVANEGRYIRPSTSLVMRLAPVQYTQEIDNAHDLLRAGPLLHPPLLTSVPCRPWQYPPAARQVPSLFPGRPVRSQYVLVLPNVLGTSSEPARLLNHRSTVRPRTSNSTLLFVIRCLSHTHYAGTGCSGPPQASLPSEVSSPRQDVIRFSVPLRPLCMGLEAALSPVLSAETAPRPLAPCRGQPPAARSTQSARCTAHTIVDAR
ncbi:hypothetical protein NDU88_004791 [Pleurodeles waltl]|uniref:Uncharacterized protein n=1 Tax=Pleurodeles waltl TaxID=8319 RepID=A0AAV7SJY3_PLEWA|nr:hypothetical protein NDU88_004791 [Pleurodeles waltl]